MSWPNEREGMLLSFYGHEGPRTYAPSDLPVEVEALSRGGYVTLNYAGSHGNFFVEITDLGLSALGMPPRACEA